jgi:hypothetical protein
MQPAGITANTNEGNISRLWESKFWFIGNIVCNTLDSLQLLLASAPCSQAGHKEPSTESSWLLGESIDLF